MAYLLSELEKPYLIMAFLVKLFRICLLSFSLWNHLIEWFFQWLQGSIRQFHLSFLIRTFLHVKLG